MIGKLLGVATASSAIASTLVLNRLLANAVALLILVIMAACMCCVLLLGIFAAVYIGLLHTGVDPYIAAAAIAAMVIAVTATLILLTARKIRRLQRLPDQIQIPVLAQIDKIVLAFVDGLLEPRISSRH